MPEEIKKSSIQNDVSLKIREIGERIRHYRKEQNLSQQDLAFYSFCDKCLISEIERGVANNITLFTIFKLSKVLEIDVNIIFKGE